MQRFTAALKLLRQEGRRCAAIDIETDSTILADEQQEREDRNNFLSAAGAFLQQAVPAMEATPELGPLLGAMLMFVVRTFPSSRPIEEEFDKVQKALAARPPQQQQQQDPDPTGNKARAQADMARTQSQEQIESQKLAAETQHKQVQTAAEAQNAAQQLQLESTKEMNRHNEALINLRIQERLARVKEIQVGLDTKEVDVEVDDQQHAHMMDVAQLHLDAQQQDHQQNMDQQQQDMDPQQQDHQQNMDQQQQYADDGQDEAGDGQQQA
jgi:hypothetical protein